MTGKNKKPKEKPKTFLGKVERFLDKVIIVLGMFLAAFIITMIVTFWKFQSVPDTLIEAVLNTGKFEAALTAGITIVKLIVKKNKEVPDTQDDLFDEEEESFEDEDIFEE